MSENVLELDNYGVAFGDREILTAVTLKVPVRGATVLVGPVGTGKSTLLRTLAGVNDASPSLQTWGTASYMAVPLGQQRRPVLVAQKAKLMLASVRENIICELPERNNLNQAQQRDIAVRLLQGAGLEQLSDRLDDSVVKLPLGVQRHLAVLRAVAANPELIMVDEPTADIGDDCCARILRYLVQESERRALLVVFHNQKHARALGGQTALLAGGRIQEVNTTAAFFQAPQSDPGKDFVRSGSCCVMPPQDGEVDAGGGAEATATGASGQKHESLPKRRYVSDAFGPRNFLWLKPGLLAGTPQPGLFVDLDYDLAALQRVGVAVLVSLTEKPLDAAALQPYGIEGIWFPIEDMGCPQMPAAAALCAQLEQHMVNDRPVALHCHAGMGRTGTMLAAQLIWEGATALDALESARRIEPRWVQSEQQVDFLANFFHHLGKCAKPNEVVLQ